MGFSKSRSEINHYSDMGLPQETKKNKDKRKILTNAKLKKKTTPNFTPKGT